MYYKGHLKKLKHTITRSIDNTWKYNNVLDILPDVIYNIKYDIEQYYKLLHLPGWKVSLQKK